jgi:RHS repeat-associated protein
MLKRDITLTFTGLSLMAAVQAQVAPLPPAYPAATKVNLVRTWDAVRPGLDSGSIKNQLVKDVKQTTAYFDGLGRPLQTVAKQASQATGGSAADMVSAVVYDAFGRVQYHYLPFAAGNAGGNTSIADGKFKLAPFAQQQAYMQPQYGTQGETFFYGKTDYEASPLNRPEKTMPPGNSWAGSGRGVQSKYWINTMTDSVKIWTVTNGAPGTFAAYATAANYMPGSLYKIAVVDEHGKQTIEYKDKAGKVILKKVQLTAADDTGSGGGYTGWLCTYYIYDDLGNLRCVLQPAAVDKLPGNGWLLTTGLLDELCFRYEYDTRNRMSMKKAPGAAPVYMVYDMRDRLVLMQDGNLRSPAGMTGGTVKWQYTLYDGLNRPIATGLWTNNQSQAAHAAAAENTAAYPSAAGLAATGYEELSNTYYDHYNWLLIAGVAGLTTTYSTAYNTYLQAASNTAWPYAQANVQSAAIKGMTTGNRVKVLGTANTYLYSVPFYDDKSRVIQTQATNASGGIDISTMQYTWLGQPLVMVQKQQKAGINAQTIIVVTQLNYDEQGRLTKTEKKIGSSLINNGAMPASFTTTVQNEYDNQGQLKKKGLGSAAAGGTNGGLPLESLTYDYNIRGWMLGANRDYVKAPAGTAGNWFGFELAYDKTSNIVPGQNYAAPQYNGNIGGSTWRAAGDGEKRKYDFSYDAANRLTGADFNQLSGNAFNKTAGIDYSVSNLGFDANGNILTMSQKGWSPSGMTSTLIDRLKYSYQPNSNKLISLYDTANNNSSRLGDFKFDAATKTSTDYSYDVNGNMVADNNKKISSIAYNYLNLPQTITVTNKGSIEYVYDAGGNKLKKIVHETGKPDKTTEYMAGFVYENDVLQFTGHEEGRIRFAKQYYVNGDSAYTWQYDYFLKDHLGNIRTVLTEQTDTAKYMATFETGARTTETALFDNIAQTAYPIASILNPAYPADGTTDPNKYTSRLVGNGKKTGATIGLKVMAGDKVDVAVKAWVPVAVTTEGSSPKTPEDILSSLVNIMAAKSAMLGGKATAAELNTTSSPLYTGMQNFLNNHGDSDPTGTSPRAFLNWILFDEQFNYVPAGSGFLQVKYYNDRRLQSLAQFDIPAVKSGYFFVFLTNETKDKYTFFDNLVVQHYSGPLVEENAYYPFGLLQQGISSKAAGRLENKFKYNGKEEQRHEFSDVSGLEWVDYGARMYDAQIGRWFNADPLADITSSFSPYVYGNDNPVLFIDPTGMISEHSGGSKNPDWVNDNLLKRNEKEHAYIADRINIDEKSKRIIVFTDNSPVDFVTYDNGNTWVMKPKGWFNKQSYSDAGYSVSTTYALGTGAFTEAVKTLLGVKLLGWVFGRAGSWLASRLASKMLQKAGTTVLGKTGFYEALAKKLGANRFIAKAGQNIWEANKKFLDDAIARGDKFVLSNSYKEATGGFAQEINYLLSEAKILDKGYKIAEDGMSFFK